jgi:hypothetical protein
MTTSQNGYPASPDRDTIGVRTFQVPGRPDVEVPLRADIAPLILEFMRWWNVTVEPLMVPGCWGYSFREISGSNVLSNHASGTAGDVNAPRHPIGQVGTVADDKRAAISAKAAALGLRWGGDYNGRKDEMHVEVIVPQSRALELVAALRRPVIREGSTGQAVRDLQAHLKQNYPLYAKHLVVDGMFGPKTRSAVEEFQRRSGLDADGVVGPKTWEKLGL